MVMKKIEQLCVSSQQSGARDGWVCLREG